MDADPEERAPAPGRDDLHDAEWRRLLAEAGLTEAGGLPPSVVASPSEVARQWPDPVVRCADDTEICWWRPGWRDAWRFVGWRWALLAPCALLALLLLPGLRWPNLFVVVLGAKLLLFSGAIAITLAGYVLRRAARARAEPFCIFCGYNLTGLPDRYRCPECGRPYTWRLIAEYRRDPAWFVERYRALRNLPPADAPFAAGPRAMRGRRDGT